ncbi:facilitated trehalose transporter Tret1-like [Sitodiplosis mosellana]|uniref:facilitated trehalose transporter Tret1-like n=1 Tax=Sitodiplosis mosellana TaxID=263140 RepID=UPI0024438F81|nr:facilitated trehalose transporter Tret1-like [Sitodiplosis mosellana]
MSTIHTQRDCGVYVAGGVYTIIPPFLAEICNDRVRGVLGSTLVLFCNLGILLAFTFGTYFDFYMTPKFVIVMTILCAILLFLFPESSTVLLKRNQISLAEESIRFYQNLKNNSDFELLQAEMTKLKSTVKGGNSGKSSDNSFKLSDLSTGAGRKAMMIGIVLAMINQLSGCFAMLQYTATIFKEAGSSMSPNMSSIVVGLLQLVGSSVATLLVERSGRKFLFIVSSVGIALGLITLGVYMMLKSSGVSVESVNFIPIVSFSFVIFIANWAVLNLPFLVISELMPENLKDFGQSFCMVVLWVCSFITIKYLPLLTESLGMHGTMFLFSGACLSAATFIIIFMPETKGKSYEEIMAVLR